MLVINSFFLPRSQWRVRTFFSQQCTSMRNLKQLNLAKPVSLLKCLTLLSLLLADLFDILLPMLNIYQEFVRNHQYSLQVLANCKQNRDFDKLLKQYESNAACEGRMLETFLTYPMFQV